MNIDIKNMNTTFIFVDGSYYCFYRYFALRQWWKNAYPDELLDAPYENVKFVEKFRKTFVENLEQIPKKLKIHKEAVKPILIVGKIVREKIYGVMIFLKIIKELVVIIKMKSVNSLKWFMKKSYSRKETQRLF
jgi:hypothetical protein